MDRAMRIIREVRKALIGKDDIIQKVLMGILSRGHILLEDIPGVGKTTLATAFSKAIRLEYKRIQFTPDVMPTDITGFTMYEKDTGKLRFVPGAILTNLLLADEINRANSRTQAALLEAMEEEQVTVDGTTYPIPKPFLVIATQNPIGAQGTQLLPDSQLDRFMLRLSIGYPSEADEIEIMRQQQKTDARPAVQPVSDAREILSMQTDVENIYISEPIFDYVVRLVNATRQHPLIAQGGSPRASLALMRLSQASAFLQGRDYVIPQDVAEILYDAVGHRLILSQKAKLEGVSAKDALSQVYRGVEIPGTGQ
ncbi:MoxR family ATPase [Eubacteriales bacterium OttesenSCG-928-M02]|nr:MoxR family ATPase [Eubacteriales bacterium OttesenSCG-928-M02]